MANGHGGKRQGAGRKVGVKNHASGELRELAQGYGPEVILGLAAMAGLDGSSGADTDATRLGAMRELLDRGYGKATQPISGEDGGSIHLFVDTGVRRHDDEPDPD